MPTRRLKLPNREMAGAVLARLQHAHRVWRTAGISPTDHLVLLEVAALNIRPPPRGASGSEVARSLSISTPNALRRLKMLTERGWLSHRMGKERGYWITQKTVDAAKPVLGALLNNLEALRTQAKNQKRT